MLGVLVYVLVVCIVIGLVWWIVDFVPVPSPLNRMVKMISIVIGVIIIIYALLSLVGMGGGLPALR
jgi:hypothetical protein